MNWKCGVLFAMFLFASIGSASAQPAIFWFNDPVGPDETVLVTGADLHEVTSATVARIPDQGAISAPQEETLRYCAAGQPIIPEIRDSEGVCVGHLPVHPDPWTGIANRPRQSADDLLDAGNLGDSASPGGWIQVFGRNIVRQPGRAQLVLQPDGSNAPTKAVLTKGDLWRGAFRVPDQLPPGRYNLRLTNGDGGETSGSMRAASPFARPPPTSRNPSMSVPMARSATVRPTARARSRPQSMRRAREAAGRFTCRADAI